MSMVREASRGVSGTNVRTAAQAQQNREIDLSAFTPLARRMEIAEEAATRMGLTLLSAFGAEGEPLRVRDAAGTYESFEFRRSTALSAAGMFIEPGSSAPQDRMLKQAMTVQRVQAGIIRSEKHTSELQLQSTPV